MNMYLDSDVLECCACHRPFRDTAQEKGWKRTGINIICRRCLHPTIPDDTLARVLVWLGVVGTLVVFGIWWAR
jgi:hypothetical protein